MLPVVQKIIKLDFRFLMPVDRLTKVKMPAIIIVNNKLKRLITNQVALRVNDSKETSSIWTEVAEQLTVSIDNLG